MIQCSDKHLFVVEMYAIFFGPLHGHLMSEQFLLTVLLCNVYIYCILTCNHLV